MTKTELKQLFSREDFLADLRSVDSVETLQCFLERHDLKMSTADIGKAIKTDAELTETELDGIGGGMLTWIRFAWKCFTFGMIECE